MVLGISSTGSSAPSIEGWIAKLQENAVSEEDLLLGVVKNTSEQIKEVQEKALEKAKETEGETEETDGTDTTAKSDGIKDPSEITKQDIQSPVDIKL